MSQHSLCKIIPALSQLMGRTVQLQDDLEFAVERANCVNFVMSAFLSQNCLPGNSGQDSCMISRSNNNTKAARAYTGQTVLAFFLAFEKVS